MVVTNDFVRMSRDEFVEKKQAVISENHSVREERNVSRPKSLLNLL